MGAPESRLEAVPLDWRYMSARDRRTLAKRGGLYGQQSAELQLERSTRSADRHLMTVQSSRTRKHHNRQSAVT